MDIEQGQESIVVHCDKKMDSTSIADQYKIMLTALKLKKPIHIDASNVSTIDTAGIQLLLSFIRSAAKQHIQCQFKSPSQLIENTALLLGIDPNLEIKKEELT